jgi:hypothetical protein
MPHSRIVDGLPCAARNALQMELYKNTFGLSTIRCLASGRDVQLANSEYGSK